MTENGTSIIPKPRTGIVDIWQSWMVEGVTWDEWDIPCCPTTATDPPKALIPYWEAKTIHRREMRRGNDCYHIDAFVHTYGDDQKFDGIRSGMWQKPNEAIEVISHCDGLITPDASTYADFPDPLKRYNTYRMRAFGYYAGKHGIAVINNIRWGTIETWPYCFRGVERDSMLAIGTVASNPWKLDNRPFFEEGLREMVRILSPKTIVVYGSVGNQVFDELRSVGIRVIGFPSQTNLAFRKVARHE